MISTLPPGEILSTPSAHAGMQNTVPSRALTPRSHLKRPFISGPGSVVTSPVSKSSRKTAPAHAGTPRIALPLASNEPPRVWGRASLVPGSFGPQRLTEALAFPFRRAHTTRAAGSSQQSSTAASVAAKVSGGGEGGGAGRRRVKIDILLQRSRGRVQWRMPSSALGEETAVELEMAALRASRV
eukprot:4492626-Prymnesium_polylepis.1